MKKFYSLLVLVLVGLLVGTEMFAATAPSIQASSIGFSGISTTGNNHATIIFRKGNGAQRVVVYSTEAAKTSATVAGYLSSTAVYTNGTGNYNDANSVVVTGHANYKVIGVLSGNSRTLTLSNLPGGAGVVYVLEYNTDGVSPEVAYSTAVGASNPRSLNFPSGDVGGYAVSGITATGATLKWSAVPGATYYSLKVSTSNTFADTANGGMVLDDIGLGDADNGVDSIRTWQVSGLNLGTQFYFGVIAHFANGSSTSQSVSSQFTTLLPQFTFDSDILSNVTDELQWTINDADYTNVELGEVSKKLSRADRETIAVGQFKVRHKDHTDWSYTIPIVNDLVAPSTSIDFVNELTVDTVLSTWEYYFDQTTATPAWSDSNLVSHILNGTGLKVPLVPNSASMGTNRYFIYRLKGTGLHKPSASGTTLTLPARPATPTSTSCFIAIAGESLINLSNATGLQVQQNTGSWQDASVAAGVFSTTPSLTIADNDVINLRVKATGSAFASASLSTTAHARPIAPATPAFTFTPGADQYKLSGVTDQMQYQYNDGGATWTTVPASATYVTLDATAETKTAIYVRYIQNCTTSTATSSVDTITFSAGAVAPSFCAAEWSESYLYGLPAGATNLEAKVLSGTYYPVVVDSSGRGAIMNGVTKVTFAEGNAINVRVVGHGTTQPGTPATHNAAPPAGAPALMILFKDIAGVDYLHIAPIGTTEYSYHQFRAPWTTIVDSVDIALSNLTTADSLLLRTKCNAGAAPSIHTTLNIIDTAHTPTITIADATGDKLYGLPASATGMEARIGYTGAWSDITVDANGIATYATNANDTVYVRYKAIAAFPNYMKPSVTAKVAAEVQPAAPAVTFTFTAGPDANIIKSTTASMEYSFDGGTAWHTCLATATPVAHDSIQPESDLRVRYKQNAPTPFSASRTFNILESDSVVSISYADAGRDQLIGLPADKMLGVLEVKKNSGAYAPISTNASGVAAFICAAGDTVTVRYAAHDTIYESNSIGVVAVDPPAFVPVDTLHYPDFSFDNHSGMTPWLLINLNDGMEYSTDGELSWTAATGATANLTGRTITPAFDIKVRNAENGGTPASLPYSINIVQGDTTAAHDIDFENELLATYAQDEFATDTNFISNYGSGAIPNILTGAYAIKNADTTTTVYIRERASYHTTAKTPIAKVIPARRVGPTMHIDYVHEYTTEILSVDGGNVIEYKLTTAADSSQYWNLPPIPANHIALTPGVNFDFRYVETDTSFKSQIATLVVSNRPAAPAMFNINYVTEKTVEVLPTSSEWKTSTMDTAKTPAGTAGIDSALVLTPGQDIYYRVAASNTTGHECFYGAEQHLVVKARQAAPTSGSYSINFRTESTKESVPATQEYADNIAFTGAVSGVDTAKAALNPAATAKTIYFRNKAIVGSQFHSDTIQLAVPARSAAPTASYTVNYVAEKTNEPVASNLEWSRFANFSTKYAGGDTTIEALPSMTYYFRQPSTDTSFGTQSASYTTHNRPAVPTFTIDYIHETTNETADTTIEYGFTNAYGNTGASIKIALAPGVAEKTLYARVAAVAGLTGNYRGIPQTLTIPARPVAVGVGINYLTEETTGPFDSTYQWGYTNEYGHMCDGAHNPPLNPGATAHDFFLRKAASQANSNFTGLETSIVIPARPAAPAAYSINYVAETTVEAVPTSQEFSINSNFGSSVNPGTGAAIALMPGTDMYFRVKASNTTPCFHSENTALVVPARPTVSITANGLSTYTPRTSKAPLTASVDAAGKLYWLVADSKATDANKLDSAACTAGVPVTDTLYNGTTTTTYYVAYRGAGFISAAVPQTVSVYAAPSTNATALNFSGAPAAAVTVNWTNGNGTGVMVVRQAGNNVTFVPVNGTSYTQGQYIDANTKVVYCDGLATTYTDNTTTNDSAYAYRAYAYNGVASNYVYNTTTSAHNPWLPLYIYGTATAVAPRTKIETGVPYTLELSVKNRANVPYSLPETVNVAITDGAAKLDSIRPTSLVVSGSGVVVNDAVAYKLTGASDVVLTGTPEAGYFVGGAAASIQLGSIMVAEPTVQATSIIFGSTSCNGGTRQIQVRFAKPTTPSAGLLVVGKQAATLNDLPVDGVSYKAQTNRTIASNFSSDTLATIPGGAKVLYNLADAGYTNNANLLVTNLTPSSQFRVRVFAYNGTPGTENYLTACGTFNPRSITLSSCTGRLGDNTPMCEISAFNARSSMGNVFTKWNVSEENMVVGYTLERAEVVGETPEFTEVTSYVSNNDMAGTLSESTNKTYTFTDKSADLRVGKEYLYRLSFTDVNGEKQQLAEDVVTVVNMNTEGDQMLTVSNVSAQGNELSFDIELAQSLAVTAQIVDMTGMTVTTPISGKVYQAGQSKLSLDITSFTSGTYFLNVATSNGEAVVQKFVVVK